MVLKGTQVVKNMSVCGEVLCVCSVSSVGYVCVCVL